MSRRLGGAAGGSGMIRTGVGGFFSAAHTGEDGRLHGHSYEVVVWFQDFDGCAVALKQRLDAILSIIDHGELPPELASGEAIAEWIAELFQAPRCVQVDVARPIERFFAQWRREGSAA